MDKRSNRKIQLNYYRIYHCRLQTRILTSNLGIFRTSCWFKRTSCHVTIGLWLCLLEDVPSQLLRSARECLPVRPRPTYLPVIAPAQLKLDQSKWQRPSIREKLIESRVWHHSGHFNGVLLHRGGWSLLNRIRKGQTKKLGSIESAIQ
jgi:hypothetical protein